MKMTLGRKILTGFVTCTLIMVAVAFFSFRNSEKFIETNQWVNHTHEVLYEFDQLLTVTVDAETGMRGFLITQKENFLAPYLDAKERIKEHLDNIQVYTEDNPTQQKNVEILRQLCNQLMAHLDECVTLGKNNIDKARELTASGQGKQLEDDIRRLISKSKKIENDLLVKRKEASEEDAKNFNTIFISLLVVIGMVLVTVYLIIVNNLNALKKAEKESNDTNWLLQGNAELNEKARGEREEQELAQAIIEQICNYLKAPIGVIYLFDNGQLELAGSYAFHVRKHNQTILQMGEGLVGQAAREKKTIVFTDIPDDYIKINSGLGNSIPKNILVMPLLQSNQLRGVIEIGTSQPLTALEIEFLNRTNETISILINAAQARSKMQSLLEETQRQAEELETQQEELKQSNEELQEKSQLLEKSEGELKAQQEELQQINEELEEKANLLEDQKDKLENAKIEVENKVRELEVSSKYKSEFLANMSHELRTPLNSILILAQLLAENKSQLLGEKEIEFSKNIYNSGTDLLNLINEILDLSKVESGKIELEITDVPFTEITEEIKAMFAEVAKNKAIDFNIELIQEWQNSHILTDKQRLEQIVRNLLSNAFKFTNKGGKVALSIHKPEAQVLFKNNNLRLLPNVVAITVTDNGIGIPANKQEIIFEAFQQADGSTKRKYGGTGLGLSISLELANALGGEIHLQSVEGKGSTFTLYLPLQFESSVVIPASKTVEVKEKKNVTTPPLQKMETSDNDLFDDRESIQENDRLVLILEDDKEFARHMLEFVRSRGYKAIVALQGNTGLSYARHYVPDAILLDMKLPVMDGTEVLKQLKNDPALRHIPVQVISGYDKRKEGMELGAFDFIRKPLRKDDLQNAFGRIEEFMSRKLKRLLIIEDNTTQNKAIRELIGNGDVKCSSAYSGGEAFEMMQKEHYDCIIVDLGLPDMTGFELLDRLKADNQLKNTPVVVYTGSDLNKEETTRLNKLANAVVLKTADSQERLLDETSLFLHRVESKLPKEKQNIIRKLHKTDEVLIGKKILVVDDDIRNIYSLTNMLEEEGIQCLTAENGKAALKMLSTTSGIDMILMDVMMPEMDGYEATREIRKQDKFSKIPIIALTAKAMKGDREKCLEAGMSDYVSKPVNIEQLLSLMRVWLYK